ncbi:MAG: MFS transporter [Actinobacteria bacterium]|nr:MFS transporter [Actinomycetota bacterium]
MAQRPTYDRDFKLLVTAQFLAQGADGIAQAAFADILVLEPTSQGTPGRILALFAITLIPYSIIAPFLGVFVDRWDRRKLLAWTNAIRAVLLLTIFLWSRALPGDGALFVAVLVLQGLGRLFLATKGAVLPVVLHEHHLIKGNALSGAGGTLSAVTGGGIGLAIVGFLGANGTLTIAGLLYVIPIFAALRIGTNMSHPHARSRNFVDAVRDLTWSLFEGVREIARRPRARLPLLAIFVLRSFGIFIAVLIILLIKREFIDQDDHFGKIGLSGLALGFAGLGALVAAISASRVGARIGTGGLMVLGYLSVASSLLLFGRPDQLWELFALAGLSGAGGFYCKVGVDAQVQAALPDEYRGRAFSLYDILYNLASVVGGSFVVILADSTIGTMLTGGGIAALFLAAVVAYEARRIDIFSPAPV